MLLLLVRYTTDIKKDMFEAGFLGTHALFLWMWLIMRADVEFLKTVTRTNKALAMKTFSGIWVYLLLSVY